MTNNEKTKIQIYKNICTNFNYKLYNKEKRITLEKTKNFKSNFIWNILGTGLNAVNSLFFMICVTRINGTTNAGIFTIAFSTACVLYVIGVYAGRVYQVTDRKGNITDNDYIFNRLISCVLMIIIAFAFVIIRKYDIYKTTIFMLLAFYKCIEAFSDVIYGVLQKKDFLNIVGKSYFFKSLVSIIAFIVIDYITKQMIFSCIAIIVIWLIFLLFYDIKYAKKIVDFKLKINLKNVNSIFKNGFFIFAITFFSIYITNAQKYAIDRFLTEDIQAIFGIIIMPATVMALFSQFLMHPYLTTISELCDKGQTKELNKLIFKIVLSLFGLGLFATLLAYFIGIPVLELLYGISLKGYEISLAVIIIAATLYNVGIIYSSVLTTIRKTFIQFIIYLIVSAMSLFTANFMTKANGIYGAVTSYFISMAIFFVLYIIIDKIEMNKLKKQFE